MVNPSVYWQHSRASFITMELPKTFSNITHNSSHGTGFDQMFTMLKNTVMHAFPSLHGGKSRPCSYLIVAMQFHITILIQRARMPVNRMHLSPRPFHFCEIANKAVDHGYQLPLNLFSLLFAAMGCQPAVT